SFLVKILVGIVSDLAIALILK
ncbi:MAG: hypothetical protein RLZZ69_1982, partial [Cyanobacteriota bacterium]